MTFSVSLAMFMSMVALATIPGPGTMVVIARSLSQGFSAGIVTSVGIVVGDYVFIVLAILGLAGLAQHYADIFQLIRYAGAFYLVYLGIAILRTPDRPLSKPTASLAGYSADFFTGLLTTLSNPKAILFYLSLFPAFLDLAAVDSVDIAIILAITTASVGGVMVFYAWLAVRSGGYLGSTAAAPGVRWTAALAFIAGGIYVAARA